MHFGLRIKFAIDINKDRNRVSWRKIRMRCQEAFDLSGRRFIAMQGGKHASADSRDNGRERIELLSPLDFAQGGFGLPDRAQELRVLIYGFGVTWCQGAGATKGLIGCGPLATNCAGKAKGDIGRCCVLVEGESAFCGGIAAGK